MSARTLTTTETALVFIGVMVGLAAIGEGAGALMMRTYDASRRPEPVTRQQAARLTPSEPRLQVDPLADRRTMVGPDRRAESFGWTDRAHGRAHVPVDTAIHLLAQQGWPEGGS